MYIEGFAIIKDDKVIGFIIEESQKEYLLTADPELQFLHFNWNLERPFYPSDFKFIDNQLVRV